MTTTPNTVCKLPVSPEECGPLMQIATREVFQMMLNCDLQPTSLGPPCPIEVTAVVGMAGKLSGVFSVKCSSRAAVLMTAAMLGISPETVTQDTWDAVGEVCNMIAGNFKAKLKGVGEHCMLSVPTVVSGADYSVRSLAHGSRVERAFLFEKEPIWITLDLES